MTTGRPTKYNDAIIDKAHKYANGGWVRVDTVPTVAGLACELGISRETCYAWAADPEKAVFSDILSKIAQTQERSLVNNGLKGEYNAAIAKMMLTQHGYSERISQDHTSSDGTMTPQVITRTIIDPKPNEDA